MSVKIYLTGAPAAGKSTLSHHLRKRDDGVSVFEYGREMAEHLSKTREGFSVTQRDLRKGTNLHVTSSDIHLVNAKLVEWIDSTSSHSDLIIDGHQVTIESFGFRLAPFPLSTLHRYGLSEIWVLFASAPETIRRIQNEPKGRRLPTTHQADLHTSMQLNLAATYAAHLGVQLYAFDSESVGSVVDAALDRLDRLRRREYPS